MIVVNISHFVDINKGTGSIINTFHYKPAE